LFSDKPYELKEKINEAASMPMEGPQEEPLSTKEQCQAQLLMTYQWNKDEDLIGKKKTPYTSQMLTVNMLHR